MNFPHNNILVTGAAGFIGSTLVDRLLEEGKTVVGYDNLSTGRLEFLDAALSNPNFSLVTADCLDLDRLTELMRKMECEFVFHLAANADVRFGVDNTYRDLEQNTLTTYNVLEAMKRAGVGRIAFSSTGSVYGETEVIPTPEDAPFPIQTSLYAASKLACEGLIEAYCEGFGFQAYIFRFVSILGERYTHGHIFDFYQQLLHHPKSLNVLGDGRQRKSYLYVQDCIDAMMHVISGQFGDKDKSRAKIYNLGADDYVQVNDSIDYICESLRLSPHLIYSGGERGWVGDNPFIFLDTTKIRDTGWKPKVCIESGIVATLRWLQLNPWVYVPRKVVGPETTRPISVTPNFPPLPPPLPAKPPQPTRPLRELAETVLVVEGPSLWETIRAAFVGTNQTAKRIELSVALETRDRLEDYYERTFTRGPEIDVDNNTLEQVLEARKRVEHLKKQLKIDNQ